MNIQDRGYSHILDSIKVSVNLPFEIIPNYYLRKAETEEIERIKSQIPSYVLLQSLYEFEVKEKDNKLNAHRLPPDKWNYYVISFSQYNDELRNLEYAFNLLKSDISLGCTFFNSESGSPEGTGIDFAQVSTFYTDHHVTLEKAKLITYDDLSQAILFHDLFSKLDKNEYPTISKSVIDFHQTKIIPNRSSLKILSYFSIIECLLTHLPRPTDTIGTITHQISTKMSLLGKRFQRNLDYAAFFPAAIEPENIWHKLYAIRSRLAHGEEIDFNQKYSSLVSLNCIREFLLESLKLLISYSLNEPDFITDLQKC